MRIQPVVVFETIAFESKYLKMCKELVEALGLKLRTATRDAAAILRMRTAAQPHQAAIAV
jgi:hypothetical protein